jgi:hypothetical protein
MGRFGRLGAGGGPVHRCGAIDIVFAVGLIAHLPVGLARQVKRGALMLRSKVVRSRFRRGHKGVLVRAGLTRRRSRSEEEDTVRRPPGH